MKKNQIMICNSDNRLSVLKINDKTSKIKLIHYIDTNGKQPFWIDGHENIAVTGEDGAIRVWNIDKGICTRVLQTNPNNHVNPGLAFKFPYLIVAEEKSAKIWNIEQEEVTGELPYGKEPSQTNTKPIFNWYQKIPILARDETHASPDHTHQHPITTNQNQLIISEQRINHANQLITQINIWNWTKIIKQLEENPIPHSITPNRELTLANSASLSIYTGLTFLIIHEHGITLDNKHINWLKVINFIPEEKKSWEKTFLDQIKI